MRIALLTLALCFAALLQAAAIDAPPPQIHGMYECDGNSPTGKYTVGIVIVQRGDNYFLTWTAGNMQGVGIRVVNHLSVAFVNVDTGGMGVAHYQISGGKLHGHWAGGNGTVYTETCSVGRPA